MINRIENKAILLEKALDAAWLKNEAISNNIANVNTPGYKKTNVNFGDTLADTVNEVSISGKRTREKHIPIGSKTKYNTEVSIDEFTSMRRDENNVDVDVEMAELAKNTIKYNALISQLSREYNKLSLVINDGRK